MNIRAQTIIESCIKKQYYLQRKKKEKKNVGIEINKNSHNSNTKRKTLEESEKILKSIPLSLASGHDSYSLQSLKAKGVSSTISFCIIC